MPFVKTHTKKRTHNTLPKQKPSIIDHERSISINDQIDNLEQQLEQKDNLIQEIDENKRQYQHNITLSKSLIELLEKKLKEKDLLLAEADKLLESAEKRLAEKPKKKEDSIFMKKIKDEFKKK